MADGDASLRERFQRDLSLFGFDAPEEGWLRTFSAATHQAEPATLGRFTSIEEISRGGQGVVSRAIDSSTGQVCALKRIRYGVLATVAARRRFEREIGAMTALSHPNIVRILCVEYVRNEPLLVMEWIDGRAITEWAAGQSVREMLQLLRKVCAAVTHAHQKGVLHRDLKPSNILVREVGGRPEPCVLDFGLAKLHASDSPPAETMSLGFIGTPAYASPEQLTRPAADLDVRADVYSLGVILYEMLTGSLPFAQRAIPAAGGLMEQMRLICEGDAPPASRLRPSLDSEVNAIVMKAISRSREERYQSVAELQEDVQRYLDALPVRAVPQRRWYLLKKTVRRHKAAASLCMIGLLVIITFIASLTAFARNEAEARRNAEQVGAFLQQTLAAAGPSRRGGDVALIDVLADAHERANRELAGRPQVAAPVLATIGDTYAGLWRWREAAAAFEQAAAMYAASTGRESVEYARCIEQQGRALANCSDPQSVALHREALAINRALFPGDDPRVAESLMRLGYALYRAAKPKQRDEAEQTLHEALAMYRRVHASEEADEAEVAHRDIASCLHNIGYLHYAKRDLEKAEEFYRSALEMLRDLDAMDDPYYAECMHGYTALLIHLGRFEAALAALDEAIPLMERMYGHEYLMILHWRRAKALRELQRFDEAQIDLGRALSLALHAIGGDEDVSPESRREALWLADLTSLTAMTGDWQALPLDRLLDLATSVPIEHAREFRGLLLEVARLHRAADRNELADLIYGRVAPNHSEQQPTDDR